MEPRKICLACKNPLISFQGQYLHPEVPCAGLKDAVDIEATIYDEQIQDKWVEMYGEPEMSDYERVEVLEQENAELKKVLNTSIFQKLKSFF